MVYFRYIAIFVFLFSGFKVSIAQLTADNPDASGAKIDYLSETPGDTVFCFPRNASMIVSYENGFSGLSYTWYRHNPADNSWNSVMQSGGEQLIVNDEGGYRLVVEDNDNVVLDQRFWVFNSQAITDVKAEIVYDDCLGVDLMASADSVPLICYDPVDGTQVGVDYDLSFQWTTYPKSDVQENGRYASIDPPYEDLSYVVTVTDKFGNSIEAGVDYTAIAVKADFEIEVLKNPAENEGQAQNEGAENKRPDEVTGSAPFEIKFTDTSMGKVTAWEWTFGNSGRSIDQNPRFVFSEAGQDTVYLKVVNRDSGCEDLSDPFVVNIWESQLEVPNVFTPNDDGINDEFRVAYKSLKKFEMVVFNRWGRKVYESTDPAVGWDGGGHAPGVYFYYIYAEGYNEGEVHKKDGAVHLIKGK